MAKVMCDFAMSYLKWATSKFQHQFNFTTFLPTTSSLTQLYNAYQKLYTCAFIFFVIHFHKNNFMFIGNKENTISPTIHKNITPKTSHFSLTYLCTQYHPKTNKTPFKIPITLQGYVQAHFPLTDELPLCYKSPIPPVNVVSLLSQPRHLIWKILPFQYIPSKPIILNQPCHSNVILSETNKYAFRHKSTF